MRKVCVLLLMSFIVQCTFGQLSKWTFEGVTVSGTSATFPSVTVGSTAADAGSLTAGSAFSALHASNTAWATPVGNGSAKSLSGNTWAVGDYFQFLFSTTGYHDLSLTWDATGSNTGPRDYKVQYSTDGSVFTDATGINSTYQLTADSWSSTLYNPASTRTLDLNFVTALNNNPTVYIRIVVTSTISIIGGTIASGGTSRVDDFTVNGSLIPPNTITIAGLSSTTFNLPDCFTTASGTIDFTSTDIFNSGNIFTAQLSDVSGSFATPTNIGSLALSGTAPSGTINITIPNGTASGVLYKIRIVSSDPVAYSNFSTDITINQSGVCVSSASDFFRSKADGSWNSNSTWESSPTGTAGTWIPATMTPTSTANTITIQNGHTVTVTLAVTIDQVIIENGGVLLHSVGVLTINDDVSGDDLIVQSGGFFTLSFVNNPPQFSPIATARANINTGGVLRVTVGGLTAAGTGVNASNYVYQDASVLELTTAFSTSAVTYFPNASIATIPIFRTTGILSVGAGTTTTFNGVFEANSSITFLNAGDKIFRNGIRGTGNINGSTSGTFFITGQTAELGGTGSLILPVTGLQIGSATGTTVSVTSNKTITGDISLISTSTYVDLGSNNLTVTGSISNGGTNAYIKTSSSGALTLSAIAPVAFKDFPVGNTSYNPLRITNGSVSAADFNARVATGINDPSVSFPTYGIARTWYIGASAPTPTVTVAYQYAGSDAGMNVTPTETMELLMSDYSAWSILAGNTTITPSGTDPYTVTTTSAITINNTPMPYAIGKAGGFILPLDCIISCRSRKINNNGIISWDINSCSAVNSFEVQRSVNGGVYQTVSTVTPGTQLEYSYTDASLAKGTNLYRIKVNRSSGAIKYSNTVAVINDTKGILITALSPNPVNDKATLIINAAKTGSVHFTIYDITGRQVRQWQTTIAEGSNNITVYANGLSNGVYHLAAIADGSKTVIRFVKQ